MDLELGAHHLFAPCFHSLPQSFTKRADYNASKYPALVEHYKILEWTKGHYSDWQKYIVNTAHKVDNIDVHVVTIEVYILFSAYILEYSMASGCHALNSKSVICSVPGDASLHRFYSLHYNCFLRFTPSHPPIPIFVTSCPLSGY